jgi:hypothetical protein
MLGFIRFRDTMRMTFATGLPGCSASLPRVDLSMRFNARMGRVKAACIWCCLLVPGNDQKPRPMDDIFADEILPRNTELLRQLAKKAELLRGSLVEVRRSCMPKSFRAYISA